MGNKCTKTLSFPFEVKAIGEEDGEMIIRGMASTFGNVDLYGDIIEPGAFKKTLQEKGANKIKFLWQHNPYEPIGYIKDIKETKEGLEMEAVFIDVTKGIEGYKLAKVGALDSFSIGFRTIKSRKGDDELRYISEIDLWEVSLVTFPANPKALVESVKETNALEYIEDKLGVSHIDAKKALDVLVGNPDYTKETLSLGETKSADESRADSQQDRAVETAKSVLHSIQQLTKSLNIK